MRHWGFATGFNHSPLFSGIRRSSDGESLAFELDFNVCKRAILPSVELDEALTDLLLEGQGNPVGPTRSLPQPEAYNVGCLVSL